MLDTTNEGIVYVQGMIRSAAVWIEARTSARGPTPARCVVPRRHRGVYEVRVQGGGQNHRLLCVLERDAVDLGGSSIVCIGGLSKPKRSAANPRDYRKIKQFRSEFEEHRTVLR